MTDGLAFSLDRTVLIRAEPSTVRRFFSDSELFARWWGEGSTIDPVPGGRVSIRYPNGIEAGGEIVETSDEGVVFTFGYASGKPIALGSSRVSVRFEQVEEGTRVRLRHELPDAAARDAHVPGWRYQLAVYANVAAAEQHSDVSDVVDEFLGLFAIEDVAERAAALERVAIEEVEFGDAFGCVRGRDDLAAHLEALRMHMPGTSLERVGDVLQCQGTALVDWLATGPEGEERGRGTNVVELAPDGRVRRVVGFWAGR